MDLEHFTHRGYRTSVAVAVILSMLIVLMAAFLGRRVVNLKGSLIVAEPNDITVISLVEPKLNTGSTITNIRFLRKEEVTSVSDKPRYAYLVHTSDDENRHVQIGWNDDLMQWSIVTSEALHGEQNEE